MNGVRIGAQGIARAMVGSCLGRARRSNPIVPVGMCRRGGGAALSPLSEPRRCAAVHPYIPRPGDATPIYRGFGGMAALRRLRSGWGGLGRHGWSEACARSWAPSDTFFTTESAISSQEGWVSVSGDL